ncbi:collagen alpha-1(I) chain-like [Perognathus longimembris pacificus]|uniref:collagen alpha-1(I) chain-like n=1 Tax=Perognathus longimembris pacificus TaxID=214514 RepID=UPI00201979C0|nr:collagen alpha-1(I) chain-like [Perognathus longimembris pacificus]
MSLEEPVSPRPGGARTGRGGGGRGNPESGRTGAGVRWGGGESAQQGGIQQERLPSARRPGNAPGGRRRGGEEGEGRRRGRAVRGCGTPDERKVTARPWAQGEAARHVPPHPSPGGPRSSRGQSGKFNSPRLQRRPRRGGARRPRASPPPPRRPAVPPASPSGPRAPGRPPLQPRTRERDLRLGGQTRRAGSAPAPPHSTHTHTASVADAGKWSAASTQHRHSLPRPLNGCLPPGVRLGTPLTPRLSGIRRRRRIQSPPLLPPSPSAASPGRSSSSPLQNGAKRSSAAAPIEPRRTAPGGQAERGVGEQRPLPTAWLRKPAEPARRARQPGRAPPPPPPRARTRPYLRSAP